MTKAPNYEIHSSLKHQKEHDQFNSAVKRKNKSSTSLVRYHPEDEQEDNDMTLESGKRLYFKLKHWYDCKDIDHLMNKIRLHRLGTLDSPFIGNVSHETTAYEKQGAKGIWDYMQYCLDHDVHISLLSMPLSNSKKKLTSHNMIYMGYADKDRYARRTQYLGFLAAEVRGYLNKFGIELDTSEVHLEKFKVLLEKIWQQSFKKRDYIANKQSAHKSGKYKQGPSSSAYRSTLFESDEVEQVLWPRFDKYFLKPTLEQSHAGYGKEHGEATAEIENLF